MALTLLKCVNSGLRISGTDFSIPVVKVIVSGSGEYKPIMSEVYNRSVGFTSICCCLKHRTNLFPNVPNGTYGDNNGFKVTITRYSDSYWGTYGIDIVELYYKNVLVGRVKLRTGVSHEIDALCIYVDENNNIYSIPSGRNTGLCLDYNYPQIDPGWTSIDNKYVAVLIPPDWTLQQYVYGGSITLTDNNISNDITEEIDPENTDPYNPGGDSGSGGGTGTFDGAGDDIDIPGLPTLSAVDTGFITLFNPSAMELRTLANYMWGDLFDLNTWKKIFADPMDAILGLSIVPVSVPNGGIRAVTVGNISTGVSMNVAGAQYVEVDCGTLNIEEYWGAYLDYDPFTKAEIYLPYIGTHPLAVDDIMGKAVHVVYHVDILSGACCAYVKCGGSVLYSFVGQCSCSIPITGNDWTNVVNGALSIAASIGTMVATGGATAPLAASAIASTAVNSMKPNVEKSGSMGGMGGMLGGQTPYIILTRPRQALPNSQNKFMGYPSFITRKLSDISGYTEIESIHLDGIPATEQEISEIESLLKGGAIL